MDLIVCRASIISIELPTAGVQRIASVLGQKFSMQRGNSMAFLSQHVVRISIVGAIAGIIAATAFTADIPSRSGASTVAVAEAGSQAYEAGDLVGREVQFGALKDARDGSELARTTTTDTMGRVLVDNHISTYTVSTSSLFDDAQGFATGPDYYLLAGVEVTLTSATSDAAVSMSISEPTQVGKPGTTLYELESPSSLNVDGKVFFSAPENAYLHPNTSYLVRIDVTSGSVTIAFTNSTEESESGLSGWSIADQFWSSSGITQGLNWTSISSNLYAITVRGSVLPDSFGEDTHTAGRLAFSRHTGESPTVGGFINDSTDMDWFNTLLSFDYGGRYRIDVKPVSLTNDADIGVRAFYADFPSDHSRDPVVELTSVSDPPEGYVSWHFEAGRNCGPHIEVYADNGTIGEYAIRVVYDPDKIWTGTEVVRGDLPGDDTTWATITVGDVVSDVGVYHYYDDHDWFAVELEAESSYVFLATASGAYSSYIDPALRLYDGESTELAVDYISGTDTSANIAHTVATGEGGTYYLDVTNALLMDDADNLGVLGRTDPFEIHSPFIDTRYYILAAQAGNSRNARSVSRNAEPRNAEPRILNSRAISLAENSSLQEFITAVDIDSEDSITGYKISGGEDGDPFAVSEAGVLSMTITPDFEVPADADMDNVYEVRVEATSGSGDRERSTTANFVVTVTDNESEAERVLVSNTGNRNAGGATVNNSDSALRIHTGSNSDGYVIQGVALRFREALEDPTGVRVSWWSSHKPGQYERPNSEIFAFANPASIEARLTEFPAPPNRVLEPDSDYWIMIERTGDTAVEFLETGANSEDSISAANWDIGDRRFYRTRNMNGPWTNRKVKSDRDQLKLRVIGYEASSEQ